jgi:dTDP-4-amino-4,6-dideoxygalactose transaminase
MSFGASKVITAGEDGVLLCSASDKADLDPCREYGMSRLPEGNQFTHVGLNFRITEFQAALIQNQLSRIQRIFGRLAELHALYAHQLRKAQAGAVISSPWGTSNNSCLLMSLPSSAPPASAVRAALAQRGVETETAFLMHKMPVYAPFVRPGDAFPQAEEWARRILRLPLYQTFDERDLVTVVESLKEII